MRTIQASCETYLGLVYLGKELPPAQLREVRHAFYAGAEALFKVLDDIGEDSVSEDAGVAILTGLRDEIHRYAEQVLRGGA